MTFVRHDLPRHVFVAYASEDRAQMERIVAWLGAREIPTWDDRGLRVGTPNFEAGIREAIKEAFACLLLASPNSVASTYVAGEIHLSLHHGIPVFPVWIGGEHWEESVHTQLISSQRQDLRDDRFDAGMDTVYRELIERINQVLPRHVEGEIEEPLYHTVQAGGTCHSYRLSAYPTILSLINDVDQHLVTDIHPPMYGSGWVLIEDSTSTLVLPWSWLSEDHLARTISEFDREWYDQSPRAVGIMPWSNFYVALLVKRPRSPRLPIGIAMRTRDGLESTLDLLRDGRGRFGSLHKLNDSGLFGTLQVAEPQSIDVEEFPFRVIVGLYDFYGEYYDRFEHLYKQVIREA